MNVSRVYRLLKLITILRSGQRQDVRSLAESLGVSRRTLFRDFALLERASVPIQYDYDNDCYSITESFLLPPLRLDLQEALALLLVTRKFLARQVHPSHHHALTAALKIASSAPPSILEDCGRWLEGVSIRWQPMSPADASAGVFNTLQQAVAERRRVRVLYDSVYDKAEIAAHLDPLRLVFINRGWYLIAKSHLHNQIRTFKLDRMSQVQLLDDNFKPDPSFSEAKYFGAAWRRIPEGKTYHVKLRFSPEVAASVEEVLWHGNQVTTRLPDGRLSFEADVDGLSEITPWVLSYGEHAEVLAPEDLRKRVCEKAEQVLARARTTAGEAEEDS